MRQIVLDTETTGLEPGEGHNIIEIGCVEMLNRRQTGRTYHQYIKPDREVDAEAVQVHGITNDFLEDKPRFNEVMEEFIEFVRGAELVIHNAAFDIGFLNAELQRNGYPERMENFCLVTDTLLLARKKHPGQKNNLDALCNRYGINNAHRELHGALLDSEILADVYLALTGGRPTCHWVVAVMAVMKMNWRSVVSVVQMSCRWCRSRMKISRRMQHSCKCWIKRAGRVSLALG